jgi:hypothetical protein
MFKHDNTRIKWLTTSEPPFRREPILMRGVSGYIHPNDIAYVSGYYDDEYRPLAPWRTWSGDCALEDQQSITHWIYLSELEPSQ